MRAVVVAHGEPDPGDRAWLADADLVVAADGGALICERWGVVPHVVVGDLDSLGPGRAEDLARRGARVEAFPSAKDETDTELAVRCAIAQGADEIVLLALFGGPRLDHAVANALLLADPSLRGRDVRALRGTTTVRALHGGDRLVLRGAVGDVVSLVPVTGDAAGVTTAGLRYPLRDETLRAGGARGVSNVIERAPAALSLARGVLLVFEIDGGGVT